MNFADEDNLLNSKFNGNKTAKITFIQCPFLIVDGQIVHKLLSPSSESVFKFVALCVYVYGQN